MKCHTPVIPGMEMMETVYGANQPEYTPLPALRNSKGYVLTRWKFTEAEREAIAAGADLYLCILTARQPLQPIMTGVAQPDEELTQKNIDIAKFFSIEVGV